MQSTRATPPAARHALIAACAAATAACQAAAATAAVATAAGDGAATAAPPAWAAALALVAIGWALWSTWQGRRRRRAQAAELRRARVELQTLHSVLDVWQWRTDRDHRLQWLRPPAAAADAAWHARAEPSLAWEWFRADNAAALRARLEAGATFRDVAASFDGGDGMPRRAVLRGVALCDEQGRFDGHLGTARELAPPAAARQPPTPRGVRAAPAAPAVPAVPAEPSVPAVAPPPPTAGVAAAAAADTSVDARDSESFIYTVSHDLRAPIRVIEGFTKIIKEDHGRLLDRIGNDHLDRVLGAATRMNSMIDAMLALSQLSARPLSRQPVDLSQLAAFVADDLRRQSPQRDVVLHVEPGMLVHGDPTLLRVMLDNLLGNAWKYTGKTRQPQVWFSRDRPHPAATFCLRDNGAGFDMRFADRLFGAFQRLHSASDFQGTGVGLASVRRIVRRHGGEIWAEGEVERGAAFYFTLPGR